MNKPLDEALSIEVARRIKSKADKPFDNSYQIVLTTKGATYVQGFLAFAGQPYQPIEHSWIELGDHIVDPTLPYLNRNGQELWYFPAHRLTVKQLKAIIEESQEDYPEDDPLPIYGNPPYEYYGDVMLGGKDYLEAYQAAEAKCRELNQLNAESN
ncbi:MAG: hypothetical protein DSM106950_03120 [Stigonema ocellatum SAG 48.90 = DSM 106950]|nr:hypothetical protein [Stigonema ocellatum SAG 48.90 = DSM 106950]